MTHFEIQILKQYLIVLQLHSSLFMASLLL